MSRTAAEHAQAINNAQTQEELNQAYRDAQNDGFDIRAEIKIDQGSEGQVLSDRRTVQVGHQNENGVFVPEHTQGKDLGPKPGEISLDGGGVYEERTTDITHDKNGNITGVHDRTTGTFERSRETGALEPIEAPDSPHEIKIEPLEEAPETDVPPPEEPPVESPPQEEQPSSQEPREEPSPDDPEEEGKETDCGALCKAGAFVKGFVFNAVLGFAIGAALGFLAASSSAFIAGAALVLGVAFLAIGVFSIGKFAWDWATKGKSTEEIYEFFGGLIGGGIFGYKGFKWGMKQQGRIGANRPPLEEPPPADGPERPPTDGPENAPPADGPEGPPPPRPPLRPPTSPGRFLENGRVNYSRVQEWATRNGLENQWRPSSRFPEGGFRYNSSDGRYNYTMHGHGRDPNAVVRYPGSNSASGPTTTITRQPVGGGPREYLRTDGTWGPRRGAEDLTHIPLDDSPFVGN